MGWDEEVGAWGGAGSLVPRGYPVHHVHGCSQDGFRPHSIMPSKAGAGILWAEVGAPKGFSPGYWGETMQEMGVSLMWFCPPSWCCWSCAPRLGSLVGAGRAP